MKKEKDKMQLYKEVAKEVTEVTKVFDSLVEAESPQILALRNEIEQRKKENADLKKRLEQEKKKIERGIS